MESGLGTWPQGILNGAIKLQLMCILSALIQGFCKKYFINLLENIVIFCIDSIFTQAQK